MAPEQLSGESVDGRSDLFSLGVILYAMVTGHSPFQGTSATTVCFKVANREPIAASSLDMTLPPQLDVVISRAMAKDTNERYQRGSDFADDLRILQQSFKTTSTTTSRRTSTAIGTRCALTGNTSGMRAAANAAATGQVVRDILSKARIRDLILGAATVVMLVIFAAQLKPSNNKLESASSGSVKLTNNAATVNLNSALPNQTPVQTESAPPPVPTASRKKKTPAKSSPTPAKQIVVPSSTLELAVQHQFKDATLYVWVDDTLALTLPLHGAAQKKLVVFNGVRGVTSETMKVLAGKRMLRFRALSTDQTVDLSKTLSAEFVGGDTKSLSVSFEKRNSSMRLTWQ
jgi:serine/threonine protein kinase